MSGQDPAMLARWRLVLGKVAEHEGLPAPHDPGATEIDGALEYLFEKEAPPKPTEHGAKRRKVPSKKQTRGAPSSERTGGLGATVWTIPTWVEKVGELFPVKAKEVMEKELVRRRGIASLLSEPRLLERVEANVELVKILITHKSLLNERTRPLARAVIDKVVTELQRRIKLAVEPVITGALRRDRHSPRQVWRNLDLRRTVWQNLKNYDRDRERLLVERLHFFAAERKQRPWHVVVVVDQSGSMLESAVFSAIMASVFAELPALRTSLVLFDTSVLDLSDRVGQPVDVLLSVQLGGGTDIGQAMRYAAQLVREPRRTILVLVSDFMEGAPPDALVRQTELLFESGVRLIGLGALTYEGRPAYDHHMAGRLRKAGMDILSCTPEELADCMARVITGR